MTKQYKIKVIHLRSQSYGKVFFIEFVLQVELCTLTVTDEEGLQHVNQEIEAKAVAPFLSERFAVSFYFFHYFLLGYFLLCIYTY